MLGKENRRYIEELKDMRFLYESICITNFENVANVKEVVLAKMGKNP